MTTPAMSVVMAVHNGEPYLVAAMDSVLTQTFRDFEFIVIDDCSTDRTADIVNGYGDSRVVYRRNEKNIGQTRSLNVGIEIARAPLIARIDADDLFYPSKLEKQVAYLAAHPTVAVLGTAAHVIDESGQRIGEVHMPVDEKEIFFRLIRGVPVVHVTVVMRTEALRQVGCYDGTVRYSQDYALWSEFARKDYRIANLPDTLGAFRERSDSVNASNKLGGAMEETCRITQRNAREFLGLELSPEDCRAIDLLMFPAAGLSTLEMVAAVDHLRAIGERVWPSLPLRIRLSLAGRLAWATWKRLGHARHTGTAAAVAADVRTTVRANVGRPSVLLPLAAAYALSGTGAAVVRRLKTAATRFLPR